MQEIANDAPLLFLDPVNSIDEDDRRPARANLGKEIGCGLMPEAMGVGKSPPRRPFKSVRFQKKDRAFVGSTLDAAFYDNGFPASRQDIDVGEDVRYAAVLLR